MIKTADRYLAKRLLFALCVATAVFSGPPILIALFVNLPQGYIYTELLWPTLFAIVPSILYHVLPLLAAAAIVWCYSGFSSDGTLLTLHLAGQSISRVRAPALYAALGATLFGCVLSCFLAPMTAGNLHDVLNFVRHDVYPPMLAVGRPNEFEGGRLTIIFKKFVRRNEIAGVFIRKIEADHVEKAYAAQRAVFERNAEQSHIVLFDGSYQEFKPVTGEVKTTNFDQLVAPLRSFGVQTQRGSVLSDELSTPALLRDLFWQTKGDSVTRRLRARELVERISIPALTIIHTLLGLELIALWGMMSDRRKEPIAAVCSVIISFHLAQIIATELSGLNPYWIWAVAGIPCLEIALVVALKTLPPEKAAVLLQSFATRALDRIRAVPAAAFSRVPIDALATRMLPNAPAVTQVATTSDRRLSGRMAD